MFKTLETLLAEAPDDDSYKALVCPRPEPPPDGFVYMMLNRRNGYTKLGFSMDPKYRESTLQSEEPDVELVIALRATRATERRIHRQYAEKRVRGEWFNLTEDDRATIAMLVAAE